MSQGMQADFKLSNIKDIIKWKLTNQGNNFFKQMSNILFAKLKYS